MSEKSFEQKTPEQVYYQMRCVFYEKFKEKIRPKILPFEKERQKTKKLSFSISLLLFISSLVLFLLIFFLKTPQDFFVFPFLLFIFAFVVKPLFAKSFEKKIKRKVMPVVCSAFGKLYWDFGRYNGDILCLDKSCLIPFYEHSMYDDIFAGSYKNVNFEIIEAKYTREEGSGKNKRTVTVFDGVILKLEMNKNFSSHTVIRPDSLFHIKPDKHLNRTALEDVVFEEKFDVFTNDEIEARYLITPVFMEKLKSLKTSFYASNISAAFYKGYLFMALHTSKDLFSLCSIDKPVDDFEQYKILFDELLSIIKLIDHFKLYENTKI